MLQHLSSNVLTGKHSGSHGGGKEDGWEVSSSLLICFVQGKIESIISLTLCIIDHFRGSGTGTQIGSGMTRDGGCSVACCCILSLFNFSAMSLSANGQLIVQRLWLCNVKVEKGIRQRQL